MKYELCSVVQWKVVYLLAKMRVVSPVKVNNTRQAIIAGYY